MSRYFQLIGARLLYSMLVTSHYPEPCHPVLDTVVYQRLVHSPFSNISIIMKISRHEFDPQADVRLHFSDRDTPELIPTKNLSLWSGWISHEALRKVEEQRKLMEKKNPSPSLRCTGMFTKSHGLPCMHVLKVLQDSNEVLSLQHFIRIGIYSATCTANPD
jgi:hypothetical protein